MAREDIQKLGFHAGTSKAVPADQASQSTDQRRKGFIAGLPEGSRAVGDHR